MNNIAESNSMSTPANLPAPNPVTLIEVAKARHQPLVEIFTQNQQSIIILIRLQRQINGLNLETLSSPGTDLFDYQLFPPMLKKKEALNELTLSAAAHHGVDAIFLPQIIGQIPEFLIPFDNSSRTALFYAPDHPDGWKGIYHRKSLRRHVNKARRVYGINVRSYYGIKNVNSWIEMIGQLHRERWAFDAVDSPFLEGYRGDQYAASAESALLTVVTTDQEELIALHWGYSFNNTLIWHTPLINIKYLQYSPLEILLHYVCLEAQRMGFDTMDFGLGEEAYKSRFANQYQTVHDILIPVSSKAKAFSVLRRCLDLPKLGDTLRLSIQRLRGLAGKTRQWFIQRLQRVIYFSSPEQVPSFPSSGESIYQEITNWDAFVDLYRKSGLSIHRYQYDRIRQGEIFLCRRLGERVVCYGWMSAINRKNMKVGETGRILNLQSSRVLYDFVTPERYQRQGYYTCLLRDILCVHKDESLLIYSLSTNHPSLKAIRKAGFEKWAH